MDTERYVIRLAFFLCSYQPKIISHKSPLSLSSISISPQYLTPDTQCGGINNTTCNVVGESCIGGFCRCGRLSSCEGRRSGSYCDPFRHECRCSESLESCSDPSIGTLCDSKDNSCKCSATAHACSGNKVCTYDSCIGKSSKS